MMSGKSYDHVEESPTSISVASSWLTVVDLAVSTVVEADLNAEAVEDMPIAAHTVGAVAADTQATSA